MTTVIQPTHTPPNERQRWVNVKNMEPYKTVPSFGVIMLDVTDGDDFFTMQKTSGQLVYKGHQCNAQGEQSGEPFLFLLNGPTPIPPLKIGKATQDFPGLVLHDGADDRLPNGFTCGPVANSWAMLSTGNGFMIQSHDACGAFPDNAGTHSMWVAPSLTATKPAIFGTGGGVVAATTTVEMSSAVAPDSLLSFASGQIEVVQPGTYFVSFSATVTASMSIAEATELRLTVRLQEDSSAASTDITGSRLHVVDTVTGDNPYYGGSGYATAENISCQGLVVVETASEAAPAKISLYNASAVAITASNVLLTAFPMSYSRTATGTLRY